MSWKHGFVREKRKKPFHYPRFGFAGTQRLSSITPRLFSQVKPDPSGQNRIRGEDTPANYLSQKIRWASDDASTAA